MTQRISLEYRILPDGGWQVAAGRDAWALKCLVSAGEAGCTPIDHPGPRWSGYTFNLRKSGILIETVHESHGGPFPGNHARYILRSMIEIREAVDA